MLLRHELVVAGALIAGLFSTAWGEDGPDLSHSIETCEQSAETLLTSSWERFGSGLVSTGDILLFSDVWAQVIAAKARLVGDDAATVEAHANRILFLEQCSRLLEARRAAGLSSSWDLAKVRFESAKARAAAAHLNANKAQQQEYLSAAIEHANLIAAIARVECERGRLPYRMAHDANARVLQVKHDLAVLREDDAATLVCLQELVAQHRSMYELVKKRQELGLEWGDQLAETENAFAFAQARLAEAESQQTDQLKALEGAVASANRLFEARKRHTDIYGVIDAVLRLAGARLKIADIKRDKEGRVSALQHCVARLSTVRDLAKARHVNQSIDSAWLDYANCKLALAQMELIVPSEAILVNAYPKDPPGSKRFSLKGANWYRSPEGYLYYLESRQWIQIRPALSELHSVAE